MAARFGSGMLLGQSSRIGHSLAIPTLVVFLVSLVTPVAASDGGAIAGGVIGGIAGKIQI